MRKRLLILLLAIAAGITAHAQKFALIDMEYILGNIPEYQEANARLEEDSRKWQGEVEEATRKARKLYETYQAKAQSLTEAQRTKQEEEIIAQEKAAAETRRKYFGPEGELYKRRESLMKPFEDAIYEAVKEIAAAEGYAAVIDRASASSILFASPDIDISNEVLSKLGYSN